MVKLLSRFGILGAFCLLILGSALTPVKADSPYNGVDPTMGAPISVGRCATENSFDCIVSVNIIQPDGSILVGKSQDVPCPTPPTPQGTMGRAKQQCQPPFTQGLWTFTLADGSQPSIGVGTEFDTPTWHQTPQTALAGFHLHLVSPNFMTDTDQVEFALKTSWLIPTTISGYGHNVSVENQVIPNGHLLTLKASFVTVASMNQGGMLYQMIKDPTNFSADRMTRQISVNIGDINGVVGPLSVKSTCYNGQNFATVFSDIQNSGTPSTDRNGNIVIPISGPHYLPDHQTLNTGNYEANVPVGPDACAFRDSSLIGAQSYSISVVDQNGSSEVTTNSIAVDANRIAHFRISGIHFSQPIITIKGIRANSSKQITCVNGKITQIVQGDKPICPKGFTLKK